MGLGDKCGLEDDCANWFGVVFRRYGFVGAWPKRHEYQPLWPGRCRQKNSVLPDFVPFAWQRAAMMDLNDNTGSPQTIWIISQYDSTPETSMGGRHYYLARELEALGYQVYMVSDSYTHLLRQPTRSEEHPS